MVLKRAAYARSVVPNLFTVGNMALGFFAIMAAFDKRWVAAPVAIFIAHLLDIFDGRVARWMGLSSKFGGEFDSFADWISFGIAPGIMIYFAALKGFGKLGLLLAFFYIFCGAVRLVRFNVRAADGADTGGAFSGLPIPGAGGFLAILVLLFGLTEAGQQGKTMAILYNQVPILMRGIPVIVFALSLLMISRVEYAAFKRARLFRPQSMHTLLITLFVLFMIYVYPESTIFLLYAGYILWGLLSTGWRAYRLRRRPEAPPAPQLR